MDQRETRFPVRVKLLRFLVPIAISFFFVGGILFSPVVADSTPSTSSTLSSPLDRDLNDFKTLRDNLTQLQQQIMARDDLFRADDEATEHYLRPETRSEIRSYWYSLVDSYLTLDHLFATVKDFQNRESKEARRKAFHLARGIFLTQYRVALEIIPIFERHPAIDIILNEGDESFGLQSGLYKQFKYQYLNVIKASHYTAFEGVAVYYGAAKDEQLSSWAAQDSRIILAAGKGQGPSLTFKNGLKIVQDWGNSSWLPVQKGVAEWMGSTKVWRSGQALISLEQIDTLRTQLEPGDILLERREWYMTNVGIPGFWTHAALYLGSREQRDAFSKQSDVADWLSTQGVTSLDELLAQRYPAAYARLLQPYEDGQLPSVIESISPGVSLTSLEHSASCDSIAVLRPRLKPRDRVAAVVQAMSYQGRPYDYAFDFMSDEALVCTELVVKSYLNGEDKAGLTLPLLKHMGHLITPANAFVEQFDTAYDRNEQQFDLVTFLDGNEYQHMAKTADCEVFRKTWQRPKWHILLSE
jgi:hypothetical protein